MKNNKAIIPIAAAINNGLMDETPLVVDAVEGAGVPPLIVVMLVSPTTVLELSVVVSVLFAPVIAAPATVTPPASVSLAVVELPPTPVFWIELVGDPVWVEVEVVVTLPPTALSPPDPGSPPIMIFSCLSALK